MSKQHNCPPSYETFIDMMKPSHSTYVIWFFFNRNKGKNIATCKNCREELFIIGGDRTDMIAHLKKNHYHSEGSSGFYYSYENYLEHLTQALQYHSHNFSRVESKNLKLSFGVRYAQHFTLLRFPESRKNRFIKTDKRSFKSDWQKNVCRTYIENPVGSYQGQFDRPMISKVYMGGRPLSFKEYTEFTHSPPDQCNEYKINVEKYEALEELKKIEALEVEESVGAEDLNIHGPCSKDYNASLVYTCISHKCTIPCVCKDCVLEKRQCQKHQILHPGYFDPVRHAMTVRNDDSRDINLVESKFHFDVDSKVEVIQYAGIEKDYINCSDCPKDLLHHQAYHLVHHDVCKFCRNEEYKYENVITLKMSKENIREKYEDDNLSCHLCNKLFTTKENKNKHARTQHGNELGIGYTCEDCNRLFQSKIALKYHKEVVHEEEKHTYACEVCKQQFKTKHSVGVHKRSVHNKKSFYCRKCFVKFNVQSNLWRHYRTVHGLELKKNEHAAADDKVYHPCQICEFKSIYKANLTIHMKLKHSDDKSNVQCEECGEIFKLKHTLTRHIRNVHGSSRALDCSFCKFTTKFPYNLTRHKSEKHGIEGKGTGISGMLMYSCQMCNFTTVDENMMYTHNLTIHNRK